LACRPKWWKFWIFSQKRAIFWLVDLCGCLCITCFSHPNLIRAFSILAVCKMSSYAPTLWMRSVLNHGLVTFSALHPLLKDVFFRDQTLVLLHSRLYRVLLTESYLLDFWIKLLQCINCYYYIIYMFILLKQWLLVQPNVKCHYPLQVDAALDLSHTQNIGKMIKNHFPHSQVDGHFCLFDMAYFISCNLVIFQFQK